MLWSEPIRLSSPYEDNSEYDSVRGTGEDSCYGVRLDLRVAMEAVAGLGTDIVFDSPQSPAPNPQSRFFCDAGLIRTPTAQHGQRCLDEQAEVGPQALILDVPDIHANPIFEADFRTSADLPLTSDSRSHGESLTLPRFV